MSKYNDIYFSSSLSNTNKLLAITKIHPTLKQSSTSEERTFVMGIFYLKQIPPLNPRHHGYGSTVPIFKLPK